MFEVEEGVGRGSLTPIPTPERIEVSLTKPTLRVPRQSENDR